MMDDPVQIIASLIRRGDAKQLEGVGPQLRPLFNRRNANIFMHALIDQSAKNSVRSPSSDSLSLLRVFAKSGLAINDVLDNGELPLNALMARSPTLAQAAIADPGFNWDLNAADHSDRTPLIQCMELARSCSANIAGLMLLLIESPKSKLSVKDQGAYVAFKGLYWVAIAGAVAGHKASSLAGPSMVRSLSAKSYDFNAARETPDAAFGSTINTPMAYCLKKASQWMQWNHSPVKKAAVAESVSATVRALIDCGADPSLQMEPGQRVSLMELCKEVGFPAGMTEALEAGVLRIALGEPVEPLVVKPKRL